MRPSVLRGAKNGQTAKCDRLSYAGQKWDNLLSMTHDVIVIGVGGMGSAAVYHAARRGCRVLGLEQFDIPHELGSSHGISRIIRLAYAEGPQYVPLLRRSYELWRQLEALSGERLLIITGGIDAGLENSAIVRGVLRSCARFHLPHEVLDARSLNRRFPGYQLTDDIVSVYQADSGFLIPERCIVAHVNAALALGAEVHARERVLSWTAGRRDVSVRTDRGVYRARRLILSAGPWTRTLLPALQNAAIPERQVLIWTQPLVPSRFQPGVFPIFNMEASDGRYYGFPVFSVPGFKFGRFYHLSQRGDADTMDRECHPEDEALLRAGIRKYFPDANGPTMAMKTCIFTFTPDEHFILDLHPDSSCRVAIAAGFSGHGFKFCSVVGEIMTQLVLDGKSAFDLSTFRFSRRAIRGAVR